MINYDGRRFRSAGARTGGPEAVYRQDGDLLWAEFAGGEVRRGSLAGRCGDDGTLTLAYTMVLTDGAVVAGRCRSTPEVLADGRVRLNEVWERFAPHAARGVSAIEEIR